MDEYSVRPMQVRDLPALKRLWLDVFGDEEALIDEFFRLLPDMGVGLVAESDGRAAGAAYLITGLAVDAPGEPRRLCGYLYGVAVEEASRGRGMGAALSRAAFDLGREREIPILCTEPAEPSLFAWYEQRLGTVCALRRRVERIPAGEKQPSMALSPTEYRLWREQMLRNTPHLFPGDAALRFQHSLCRCYGGGFYAIGDGIAAAYLEGGRCVVRELLCADAAQRSLLAAALAAELGADEALLCTADPGGEPYLAALPGVLPETCVWDLSFD